MEISKGTEGTDSDGTGLEVVGAHQNQLTYLQAVKRMEKIPGMRNLEEVKNCAVQALTSLGLFDKFFGMPDPDPRNALLYRDYFEGALLFNEMGVNDLHERMEDEAGLMPAFSVRKLFDRLNVSVGMGDLQQVLQDKLGIALIPGGAGTTPEHLAKLNAAVKDDEQMNQIFFTTRPANTKLPFNLLVQQRDGMNIFDDLVMLGIETWEALEGYLRRQPGGPNSTAELDQGTFQGLIESTAKSMTGPAFQSRYYPVHATDDALPMIYSPEPGILTLKFVSAEKYEEVRGRDGVYVRARVD